MTKIFSSEDLNLNTNDIGKMIEQYWDFLYHNTREFSPMTINKEYLVKAHYHQEVGRGGYFAPESGTSEAQFLAIRGALDIYGVTKDLKWLNLADELMQSALKHLYKDEPMPEVVDEDKLWLPHWLYNASEPFVAEKFYLNHKTKFTNGVATITSEYEMREVYTVRDLNAQLEWENPYSDIIGKEYFIKEYFTQGNSATITLKENFTGEAYVVYADLGGEIINHNELYEAWAIWRKLEKGETACAVDSLWWAYDSFKLLAKYTGNDFYKRATKFTKDTIVEVMKVSNMNDWHVIDFKNDDCFSGSIGLYQWQDRTPKATFTRDKNTGASIIDIPKGTGQVQYGKGGIDIAMKSNNSIEIKISSNTDAKISAFIAPIAGATVDERYTAFLNLKGDNVIRKYNLKPIDFVQVNNSLYWDLFYLSNNSKEEVYCSKNSVAKISKNSNANGREWRVVELTIGKEQDSQGNTYNGWCQYQPIIEKSRFDYNSIPKFNLKVSTGSIELRIKDSKGYYWYVGIPNSANFNNFEPSLNSFNFSSYQTTSGRPSSPTLPLQEYVFDAKSNAKLELQCVGQLKSIPAGTNINDFVLNFEEEKEQKITLYYTRPLPLEGYDYVPYVAPFTVNTVNHRIDTWRGTPYTGYQCPWIWQEIGDEKGVDTVLEFMSVAQQEFYKHTNCEGFFMPLFIWDRWDSREYGEPNTFTWNGPDPNTHWGGFQYRAIETVARAYFNDPDKQLAKDITWKFIKAVEKIWDESGGYPTNFEEGKKPTAEYREPHMMALFLRTLIYYYQTTPIKSEALICKKLIVKTLNELRSLFNPFNENMEWNDNFINGTWSVENKEWYMFWGGEILSALALIMKYCKSSFELKTTYGNMIVETFPDVVDNIEDYIKIKTPIGVQKIKLVDIKNLEEATPIRVNTINGVKAVGGSKVSSAITKEVKLLIKNEGNALKDVVKIENFKTFLDARNGLFKIESVKGVTVENTSPRVSYDYAESGNWDNKFSVVPGEKMAFSFDVAHTSTGVLTMVFKDEEDNDFGWEDISVMDEKKTIYYTKTVPDKAVSMMLYLQDDYTLRMENIMIVFGDYDKKPIPNYFEGIKHSCEPLSDVNLEFIVRKNGEIIDSIKLIDYVPEEYLPLRSSGSVCDEIQGNILYKRIDSEGNIMKKEEIVILNNTFSLFECREGVQLEISTPSHIYPDIDLKYSISMKDYVLSLING